MNCYLRAADFVKTLREDERVCLLVRHGERGHILPNDPDHGAFVALTEHGREQAFALGKVLSQERKIDGPASEEISFFSSPVGRCMETAEFIGRGFGIEAPHVVPLQPLAEFFVEHYDAYMETHKTGFYQGICRWLDGSANVAGYVDPAYFPLASRSEEMLKLMLENVSSRINIFCTHDAWIVPCLMHFCGLHFSPNLWMNFLTGMAVVVGKESHAAASAVRRIVPVTGIADGNMYF